MTPKQTHPWLKSFAYVFLGVIFGLVFWQRQNLTDWWLLRNYEPPVKVAALAFDTTMTDYGRKLFYINKPEIQEKQAFYASCVDSETSIVLGCYKPPHHIYLLKVDDPRLDGVEEVTAAHEMLHAAYTRLSDSERQRIDQLVIGAAKTLNNESIKSRLELYKQNGADVTNELHSILGTEVAVLPAALEAHYKVYFDNRTKVVALASQYQAEFTSRKQRAAALDTQLAEIVAQVDANNLQLTEQDRALTTESARLDNLLASGNAAEYNSAAAAYNQSLIPYRNLLAQTRALVAQYRALIEERNQVATEAQELNKALDTRVQTTVDDK